MVGGFVQEQQVRALGDDEGECQAGFFAAGVLADGGADFVAVEAVTAEAVALLLFAFLRQDALHVPEGVVFAAQGVQLVLGEVADARVFVRFDAARERREFAGERFHQGTFARAVAAEDADARVGGNAQGEFLQDGFVTVTKAGFLGDERRVGVVFRGLEGEAVVGFGRRRWRGVEFFQRFQAALCLACFGRLGAEAVDVVL